MDQVVQIVGAVLILAAFVLAQFRLLDQESYADLMPNLVGAAVFTVTAYRSEQWGFVLLEAVWAAVSLYGIAVKAATSSSRTGAP